jgi:hypothetical protein
MAAPTGASKPAQAQARIQARRPHCVVEQFHDFSTPTRSGLLRRAPGADWGDPPPPFEPPPAGLRLALPPARQVQAPDALGLLDAAGVSARSGGIHFRTSPSSGALFATELYVLTLNVPGVPAGLWHYDVPGQALRQVATGKVDDVLPGTGTLPADTRALIVATAVEDRFCLRDFVVFREEVQCATPA